MATGSCSVTSDLLSNGFIRVLAFFALAVAPCFALSGPQAAVGATPLPPNVPAIPTTIKNAPFSRRSSPNTITFSPTEITFIARLTAESFATHKDGCAPKRRWPLWAVSIAWSTLRFKTRFCTRSFISTRTRKPLAYITWASPPAAVAEVPHSGIPTKSGRALLSTPETSTGSATFAPPRKGVTIPSASEALGTRMIEGLPAIGTRTTRTIGSGEGDPIVAVSEVWYSRDLQMIIFSISDDGQSGHSVMRVTNIVRGAPSEKLFQVPPDYTVKDGNPIAAVIKH